MATCPETLSGEIVTPGNGLVEMWVDPASLCVTEGTARIVSLSGLGRTQYLHPELGNGVCNEALRGGLDLSAAAAEFAPGYCVSGQQSESRCATLALTAVSSTQKRQLRRVTRTLTLQPESVEIVTTADNLTRKSWRTSHTEHFHMPLPVHLEDVWVHDTPLPNLLRECGRAINGAVLALHGLEKTEIYMPHGVLSLSTSSSASLKDASGKTTTELPNILTMVTLPHKTHKDQQERFLCVAPTIGHEISALVERIGVVIPPYGRFMFRTTISSGRNLHL